MFPAEIIRLQFADPRFQTWKRSYMGSSVLKGGRFADVEELRFQTAKRWDVDCAVQPCVG